MKYAQIITNDTANGIGCRTSLFVSGCTHHCEGCFNTIAWDFNFGDEFDKNVQNQIIESLRPSYIAGLTILGGEPMEIVNQAALRPFISKIKEELPNKTIWLYSGYTWEELCDESNKRCHSSDTLPILQMLDILVDGKFIMQQRDLTLRFRGSKNQRIIDVPASLKQQAVVLSPYGKEADTTRLE